MASYPSSTPQKRVLTPFPAISALEQCLGRRAELRLLPAQPGDVPETHADCHALEALTGFRPATRIEDGIARFVAWYRKHYAHRG